MKKIDYAAMFSLRNDGRYQGYWHDLIDGKPVGARHTICDRDPEKLYNRIIELETPKSVLFQDIADDWWIEHVEKLARGTQASYKSHYEQINSSIGNMPIEQITAADINRVMLREKTLHMSYKHCATTRSMMNQIFNYAILQKHISFNPVSVVSVPRGMKRGHVEAPEEDYIEIVKKNLDKPFGNFVAVLLYTGMRTEEAAALKWGDVYESDIYIHSAVDFHGTPIIKDTKTESGVRYVPIFPALKPFLMRPKSASDNDYIFNINGKLLTRSQVSNRWINWCKDAGLAEQKVYTNRRRGTREKCTRTEWRPLIKPHQLRHHFATLCFEANLDLLTTKTIMGHKDISTTQSIYHTLRSKYKAEQLTKLEQIL